MLCARLLRAWLEGKRLVIDAGACGEWGEATARLRPFVARLPSPYREAVTLTELEGLPQKAAADMAGVSVSGMKSRVQRGRERLREMLLACCEIALDPRGHVIGCAPKPAGGPPSGAGRGHRPTAATRPARSKPRAFAPRARCPRRR